MDPKSAPFKLAHARFVQMPKYKAKHTEEENRSSCVIVGENKMGLHEAAFLKVVGFDPTTCELKYAHFGNTLNKI